MSNWENCKKRFPYRTPITEPEREHLSIAFSDYFVATERGQRFIFGNLAGTPLWSAGPTHPWRELDDNEEVTNALLIAPFLDQEYIENIHPLKGTGTYQGKDAQYSLTRSCW